MSPRDSVAASLKAVPPMTPVPKPKKRGPRARTPIARTRMKKRGPRTKKSGGAAFWRVKNKPFRDFVRLENPCVLAGRWTTRRLSEYDVAAGWIVGGYWHRCWGEMTPMHIGDHQAQGAPDVGYCVPACLAAHQEYDEHRSRWYRVTHLTERRLQARAKELAAQYVEQSYIEFGGNP